MSFLNKLNDTYNLLGELDNIIVNNTSNSYLKKQLLSVSDDLAKYKDLHKENINSSNEEIKLKITNVLNKINEIETNVKNKLIITQKYNSYLNS